jgi:acetolactate synthase-1/3 small subunit
VDVERDSVMIEMTGYQAKINAFIQLLDGYEIKEMVRTGIAGLVRGAK